jgi:hypothetical protein
VHDALPAPHGDAADRLLEPHVRHGLLVHERVHEREIAAAGQPEPGRLRVHVVEARVDRPPDLGGQIAGRRVGVRGRRGVIGLGATAGRAGRAEQRGHHD